MSCTCKLPGLKLITLSQHCLNEYLNNKKLKKKKRGKFKENV